MIRDLTHRSLDNAVVLVTGARGALGRAACAALIGAGARVVGSNLSGIPNGLNNVWMRHDVTSEKEWANVVDQIRNQFGQLDCLVNTAGICPIKRISDTSLELWRKVAAVNFESILLGMKACLPLLTESGGKRVGGSSIVNMSSVAGLRGVPFAAAYCSSKGAVTLLTKAAAKEFAALNYPIRVNSVHPSTVESPMTDENFAKFVEAGWAPTTDFARSRTTERNPMGRLAIPEEIASGIVFLCSSAASFVNGAELVIDGGVMA